MREVMVSSVVEPRGFLARGSRRQILRNIVAIALAAGLVVFLARAADWNTVLQQLRRARLSLLLFAWIGLGSLACLLRAIRWYVLLPAAKQIGFGSAFWANSCGNFANLVLPARAGEFMRAAMVSMKSDLGTRFVLAVGLCERTFDMLVLIALARMSVPSVPGLPSPVQHAINVAFWIALAAAACLVIISQSGRLGDRADSAGFVWPAGMQRIWRHIRPFVDGISSIHNRRLFPLLVLTILVWLLDAWGATLVAASLGFALPIPLTLVLVAAVSCSSLLPTTPGQLGVFQFITIRVLAICGIQYNQALAYSLVLQAGAYLVPAIWGIPALWMYNQTRASRGLLSPPSAAAPNRAQQALNQ